MDVKANAPLTSAVANSSTKAKLLVRVVFISLVLDLLAFTIILPLFPRLLEYYRENEKGDETTILGRSLKQLAIIERVLNSAGANHPRLNTVLLGGILGSLFSFLQFVSSPFIGRLSDKYGRRRILLLSMVGNLLSCLLWIFSSNFGIFLASRIVGGLSEGNVQLAIAIISDVTTPAERAKGLASVGIAFAISFTIGPSLGAFFASMDFTKFSPGLSSWGLNPFSFPAAVAMFLLLVETIYLYAFLEETASGKLRPRKERQPVCSTPSTSSSTVTTVEKRLSNLQTLNRIHFIYLFIFSGMEFTLTFLTFDLFDFTNVQQGKLLGYIGILSALLQGGYVRRKAHQMGERSIVNQGIASCTLGLISIATLAWMARGEEKAPLWMLYVGATFLAFTSATVVTGLTALASMQCIEEEDVEEKGKSARIKTKGETLLARGRALGKFRSVGQLGRAAGPIASCGLYWWADAFACYRTGSMAMAIILALSLRYAPGFVHKSKSS